MGTIVPRAGVNGDVSYRAVLRVQRDGKKVTESRTFPKHAMADLWLRRREAELESADGMSAAVHVKVTVKELIERYIKESSAYFGRSKQYELERMAKSSLAELSVITLTQHDIMDYLRERRREGVVGATANKDVVWLRVVFKYAKIAWGMPVALAAVADAIDSARHVRVIGRANNRKRRPTSEELKKLTAHFLSNNRKNAVRMELVMWLAIYSCRRQSELSSILRSEMYREAGTYFVRDIKSPTGSLGNSHEALMPALGWKVVDKILAQVPAGSNGELLPYNNRTVSRQFTVACKVLGIDDLHFHDLRHEGVSRLAEDGMSIPQMQSVSLHRDWGSLAVYVNLSGRKRERFDWE